MKVLRKRRTFLFQKAGVNQLIINLPILLRFSNQISLPCNEFERSEYDIELQKQYEYVAEKPI